METVRPQSKQGNTTTRTFIFPMKKELFRWDSKSQYTAYEANALPTELLRQVSWLGRIKAIYAQPQHSYSALVSSRGTMTVISKTVLVLHSNTLWQSFMTADLHNLFCFNITNVYNICTTIEILNATVMKGMIDV